MKPVYKELDPSNQTSSSADMLILGEIVGEIYLQIKRIARSFSEFSIGYLSVRWYLEDSGTYIQSGLPLVLSHKQKN